MANEMYASLTSFSGADLQVSFGKRVIGELQQISWAVQREKSPVYTLGSADPRAVSRAKRGIGGSLVVAQFNRDAIMEEIKSQWEDIAPKRMFTPAGNLSQLIPNSGNAWEASGAGAAAGGQAPVATGFDQYLDMAGWNTAGNTQYAYDQWSDGSSVEDGKEMDLPSGFALMHVENVVYIDQLPPVDVTLTFANEYGNAAFQKIYDMDFLNEGSGISVDTIIMERRITWIARKLSPLMQGVYQGDSHYGNTTFLRTPSQE